MFQTDSLQRHRMTCWRRKYCSETSLHLTCLLCFYIPVSCAFLSLIWYSGPRNPSRYSSYHVFLLQQASNTTPKNTCLPCLQRVLLTKFDECEHTISHAWAISLSIKMCVDKQTHTREGNLGCPASRENVFRWASSSRCLCCWESRPLLHLSSPNFRNGKVEKPEKMIALL